MSAEQATDDERHTEITVLAWGLTVEAADAMFDRVADAAHALNESLCCAMTTNAHMADDEPLGQVDLAAAVDRAARYMYERQVEQMRQGYPEGVVFPTWDEVPVPTIGGRLGKMERRGDALPMVLAVLGRETGS